MLRGVLAHQLGHAVHRHGVHGLVKVHHRPYPLQQAEVTHLRESMVSVQGLPAPEGAPHALFAAGVDVDVYRLRPL